MRGRQRQRQYIALEGGDKQELMQQIDHFAKQGYFLHELYPLSNDFWVSWHALLIHGGRQYPQRRQYKVRRFKQGIVKSFD